MSSVSSGELGIRPFVRQWQVAMAAIVLLVAGLVIAMAVRWGEAPRAEQGPGRATFSLAPSADYGIRHLVGSEGTTSPDADYGIRHLVGSEGTIRADADYGIRHLVGLEKQIGEDTDYGLPRRSGF